MNKLEYYFDPNSEYLIACTFGPDSMALLDLMEKAGCKPIVLFVNYHIGDLCEVAESKMIEYCAVHGLKIEVCDTAKLDQNGRGEDGENWGRKARYAFFKEIYIKYNAAALFIAHQQDDTIESYLTAKRSGIQNVHYGMTRISSTMGMIIVRPLLNYTKEDLLTYCQANNVPYSEEITNYEDVHSRSLIRHDVIDKLNEVERGQILDEMRRENADKNSFISGIDESIKDEDELNIREIMALSHDEFTEAIIAFVNAKLPTHINVTSAMISDIRAMCIDQKTNSSVHLKGSYYLVKEYDIISLDVDGLDLPYCFTLEKPGKISCQSFDLDFSMGAEDRGIKDGDYPLTIRSALPQDQWIYSGYLVPVRRMLVASGMSSRLLHIWPVFLNKTGKIIYVPRYRKGFSEYHSSVLNIHVKNEEK